MDFNYIKSDLFNSYRVMIFPNSSLRHVINTVYSLYIFQYLLLSLITMNCEALGLMVICNSHSCDCD